MANLITSGVFNLGSLGGDTAGGGDANFDSVVLLLDGSSATTDLSSVENTITNDTDVDVVSMTGPYGSTQDVLSFDGTSDTLTFDIDSTMQLPGDFTVEAWVKRASTGGGGSDRECLWSYWGDGTDGARCSIQFERNTDKVSFYDNSSHLDFDIDNTNALVDDTWFHIAIVRSGSTYECFVDGLSLGTNTGTTDTFTGGTSQSNKARIGALASGVITFVGEIADFRITKGVARYSSNFTPPTSALPTTGAVAGAIKPTRKWGGLVGRSLIASETLVKTGVLKLSELLQATYPAPGAVDGIKDRSGAVIQDRAGNAIQSRS